MSMKKLHNTHARGVRALPALLVALLCTVILAGCHGSQGMDAFEVPEQWDESRTYEITFWAKNDTNKTQTKIYEKAIDDFEALYPNVKVKMRLYTDYGKIYNDVITNISTNTTPNVCITYPDHIATYMTGVNTVVPLDGLFADEKYGLGGSEVKFQGPTTEQIIPEFLSECVLADEHYAIPYMRSTEICYVNKTYVEKLGFELPDVLTWDFIWEVSEAATEKNADGTYKVNGQKVLIPFIDKSTDNMMIQMLKQRGAGYSTAEGDIEIFNDDTREILTAVGEHAKSGAFSTFKISGYPANFLNAGQCIFAIDSSAGSTWMGSEAPLVDISPDKLVQFETAVRMVPQYDVDNPQMISQGPSICIFNKADSQEVLASWLFAQYLLTNDVQIAYAQTEGYVPVTSLAQDSAEYQDYLAQSGKDNDTHYSVKIDATKILLENAENTFVTPVFNGSASLRDASGQLIENVSKAVKRKQTINDTYLDGLFDDVLALYHLDQLGGGVAGNTESLGPLPRASKILIGALIVAWIGIIAVAIHDKLQERDS